jgi:hypothetical protein
MLRTKLLAGLGVMMVVLIAITSTALAAPNVTTFNAEVTATPATTTTPTASITGTVQTITPKTDANNVTTVDVTLLDQSNVTQTVTLSLADAVALGLVTVDANNVPTVNTAMIGQSVTVQSPTTTPTETVQNPVGAVIASFFGLDYSVVDGLHQDGTGYGVIAQACWMSYELNGDASACANIVAAKKSGDYSAFTLPDGSTPTNWGQFKKAASDHKNFGQTLGAIVSGHADPIGTQTPDGTPAPSTLTQPQNGNGNPNHPGNGNGNNGNGNGNGKDKDPNKKNNGKGPNK